VRGACPVGVVRLPLVAELRDRTLLVVRDEDRVEAEAAGAARLIDDPSLENAGAVQLFALRRDRHELADVARSAAFALDAAKLGEQARDMLAPGETGRLDARPAAERVDLQP
jgi:hypothetical protein